MGPHKAFNASLAIVMLAGVTLTTQITLRLSVNDPSGSFIPNLRPENFVVYENGVRQNRVTADVEHAPVILAVLFEAGGRYQQLNKMLATEVPYVARPLIKMLKSDDTVGLLSYSDSVRTMFDFDHPSARLGLVFDTFPDPVYSEANLYDALSEVLNRMAPMAQRKAVLLISSGLDTFSHTSFEDTRAQAARLMTPVYVIGLSETVLSTVAPEGPLARINWKRINDQLKTLSSVSGGRSYLRTATRDVTAVYDEIMEHLRVRYVLRYVSSNPGAHDTAGAIRVELVNPRTGAPLRLADRAGKTMTPIVTVEARDTP
jgi:VWFA-related protein